MKSNIPHLGPKNYQRELRSVTPQHSPHNDHMDTEQLTYTHTHAFLKGVEKYEYIYYVYSYRKMPFFLVVGMVEPIV